MPSNSLIEWQSNRVPRLDIVDVQISGLVADVNPDINLIDENLRGYVMLISAHFQGFCRDLHTECVQAVAIAVPAPMSLIFQALCGQDLALDAGNPRYECIKADFERFGFDLTAAIRADPANDTHITRINHLNLWRNYAAHHKKLQPKHGGPFKLDTIRTWKSSCHDFAVALDRVMYNQIRTITTTSPW